MNNIIEIISQEDFYSMFIYPDKIQEQFTSIMFDAFKKIQDTEVNTLQFALKKDLNRFETVSFNTDLENKQPFLEGSKTIDTQTKPSNIGKHKHRQVNDTTGYENMYYGPARSIYVSSNTSKRACRDGGGGRGSEKYSFSSQNIFRELGLDPSHNHDNNTFSSNTYGSTETKPKTIFLLLLRRKK